ncbi:MAG TPA: cytochrome c biogenesis protein CcdA [Pyrinomonadaceae bacterium]|jgi:thiol:disulfide interchange protein DsbD|nr:cytochrome c biogenesis protein CcdA [Pyrinomonadaceae bacterium]
MVGQILRLTIAIFIFAAAAFAQDPAKWTLSSPDTTKTLKQGDKLPVELEAQIDPGWHLYALEQPPGGPIATTIKATEGISFQLAGQIASPKPTRRTDPLFTGTDGKELETKFFQDSVNFTIPLTATAEVAAAAASLDVRFQLCNDQFCLPPKTVRVSFSGTEEIKKGTLAPAATPSIAKPVADTQTSAVNNQTPTDLGPFIWLAITLGALSLLTPCVFPMIPITVSYFTNHAGGSRSKSIKLATIYSLGIIATFTILGMLLAIFVGAAGINLFAANPWINLVITAIFLFFAFNLFGAYEITVPAGVLTKLDSLTRSKEGEGGGIIGALLMGLTFTLTSFTCTSPFVGTILVSASQGNWRMPLVGMLVFSTVFALPFFVLALAPQLISQLPRAGGWMNSVKVAMGFLEVAAAMKFISNVDLVWKWGIFTRDVVLAVWIAIGVILSLYLLGKFQLAHDSKPERLGAFRMFAAVVSLAVSFYLLTGLFGAKLGELESFLPPDLNRASTKLLNGSGTELVWTSNDYNAVLSRAKAENKRVFIDFTGYTCTNCRWMEANVFPKPEVEAELSKFALARLYTDGEGEVYERQQLMEQDRFGTVALPFYAILDSEGKTIATFPGLTRNTPEFVDFLKKAQKN